MNSTRLVVLDDPNEEIRYQGNWTFDLDQMNDNPPTRDGRPFNHTLHKASGSEASFSVKFTGTNVRIVGSLDFDATYGTPPITRCAVDGMPYGTATAAASTMWSSNQVILCYVDNLDAAEHEVKFNVSHSSDPGYGELFLDYVSFVPANSIEKKTDMMIFANDTESITYSPWWTLSNFADADQHEGVYTQGNGASLTFKFSGTSASLIGFQPYNFTNPGSATFSIDGGSPTTFPLNGTSLNSTRLNEVLFTTPLLQDSDHTLVVTNLPEPDQASGIATTGFAPLTISYFVVQTTNGNKYGMPVHAASDSGFHLGLPALIAIVAGSIGLTVIATIFGLLFLKRRRQRKSNHRMSFTVPENEALITPFFAEPVVDATTPTSSNFLSYISSPTHSSGKRPISDTGTSPQFVSSSSEKNRLSVQTNTLSAGQSSSSSHFVQSPLSYHEGESIVQHQDSGFRANVLQPMRPVQPPVELPPTYTMD